MPTTIGFIFRPTGVCLLLMALFSLPLIAQAHKLTIYAWVEGDMVMVEGKLTKGKHPRQGTLLVYDGNDRLIIEKPIQKNGSASFPLQSWESGLKIVMDIGQGHQSYWILTPYDIEQQLKEQQQDQ